MKKELKFDVVIIGGGLAGSQLALAMLENSFFDEYSIAIIEPSDKNENDKTWSFWEKGKSKWEPLLYHQWESALFFSSDKQHKLELGNYSYKTIRSIDFYEFVKRKFQQAENINWIKDEIRSISGLKCTGIDSTYEGTWIFDSRIDDAFKQNQQINILQHFKGWLIETPTDFFNPKEFTMMDFRLGFKDHCCFTYVLPFSSTQALIEYTFFTPQLIDKKYYDVLLREYIEEKLLLKEYTVLEQEEGVIPMSTYPFHQMNSNNYLKIGTAGGWVKSSSGYSFKNAEKKVTQLVDNITQGRALDYKLRSKRHELLDRIFLRVLNDENHLGNDLFVQMYEKNNTNNIFEFLDEESSLIKEFKIVNSFTKAPFMRSLKKEIFK